MSLIVGIAIILIGGIASGLFTYPFGFVRGWQWENYWFVYSVYGLIFMPWILVLFSVNDPISVYQTAPSEAKIYAAGFGLLWGVGSVMFGQGVDIVGNALGFAIILGLTSALGTAIPLVVLHPSDVATTEGICTWAGLGVACIGLFALARAGQLRERDQQTDGEKELLLTLNSDDSAFPEKPHKRSFTLGMVICLFSGVFSCMLNLAIAFGSDLSKRAEDTGTSKALADNATWALTVCSGSIANLTYCTYLLFKEKTWNRFFSKSATVTPLRNALLSALAGILWFGGNVLYGIGSQLVGDLGTVLGWPMFLSAMILTSSIVGIVTGEWRGSSFAARMWCAAGLFGLLVSVVVIAVGS